MLDCFARDCRRSTHCRLRQALIIRTKSPSSTPITMWCDNVVMSQNGHAGDNDSPNFDFHSANGGTPTTPMTTAGAGLVTDADYQNGGPLLQNEWMHIGLRGGAAWRQRLHLVARRRLLVLLQWPPHARHVVQLRRVAILCHHLHHSGRPARVSAVLGPADAGVVAQHTEPSVQGGSGIEAGKAEAAGQGESKARLIGHSDHVCGQVRERRGESGAGGAG